MGNPCDSSGLSYYLPDVDKVHTVLHIPGSHTLFIGPSACTRRHAFHAMEYGDRRHVSFLFITEADVVSGDYENLVGDAVADLLAVLDPAPHIFLLAVFCIDDFLGTDEDALLCRLLERFPDRRFAVDHIDPVTLGENPKKGMMKGHVNLYMFLRPEAEHDAGVNFLGNFVSLDPRCDFLSFLRDRGMGPVRELFSCTTYEEYQAMAKSRLAIGMRFVGEDTQSYMTDILGIPYCYVPASYDAGVVAEGYAEIAVTIGCEVPDLSEAVLAAERDARETAEFLDGMPVAVDSSAFLMPFSAAKALLGYGFSVRYIFRSRHVLLEREIAAYEEIAARGDVEIFRSDDYANLGRPAVAGDCLAIGADCRRLLGANHFADVWHDEGYFGFHGIHRLMAVIREAALREYDGGA